jgi:hypothetical protein
MSATNESWRIEGSYFESCNCELLCPCLLSHAQARPTEGHCDVVLAIHINRGNYGKTDLSGLNAVQALTTPGPMSKGGGTLAVYLDSRANPEQKAALEAIFTGNAGGPPSLMNGMISNHLPSKNAAISYHEDGRKWSVSIPNVTEVTVEGVTGAGNQVVWLENVGHPFSQRLAAAKGISSRYHDHSMNFDNSGRNGHFSAINWSNA